MKLNPETQTFAEELDDLLRLHNGWVSRRDMAMLLAAAGASILRPRTDPEQRAQGYLKASALQLGADLSDFGPGGRPQGTQPQEKPV